MSDLNKATLLRPLDGKLADFTIGKTYPIKHITNSMNRSQFLEYLMDDKGLKHFFGFTNPLDKRDREINKHFELE